MIAAVTFDFWNTLVADPGGMRPMQLAGWREVLDAAGATVDEAALADAGQASWREFNRAWEENRQYRTSHAAAFMLERLGIEATQDTHAELVAVYERVGRTAELTPAPHIGETLRALRARGIRLGVICDVGMTASTALRARLEDFGIAGLFDHASWSDEVGVYKPDPRIFDDALRGLGVTDPATAAHVGDRRRTDVAGARGAGLVSVRYTGIWDEPPGPWPEADHVIADHAELLEVLELPGGPVDGRSGDGRGAPGAS